MAGRIALILGVFVFAATGVQAQTAPPEPEAAASEPPAELKALADTCAGHKFETMVVIGVAGRGKKVTICGKPGQTDADWLNTLRSSVTQTEANDSLTVPVKEQIIAALKAEIQRLETVAAVPASTAAVPIDMSAELLAPREPAPEYSTLPSLPTPKRTVATAQGTKLNTIAAAAAPEPIIRPRLTISCALPAERFAACARLERETRLLIRADEDVAGGASLRFVRGGDDRAELELGPLRKGETIREKLPGRVCSGVLRGKVEVQILSKRQLAETLGPYALYCGS